MLSHYRRNVPTESGLHPAVYTALAGCVVWIVAIPLLFFARDSYVALQLAIIAVLCAAVILLPLALWAIWHKATPQRGTSSLKQWSSHELQTASGPVEGREAAVMVLLAPVAVALGITVTSVIAFLSA